MRMGNLAGGGVCQGLFPMASHLLHVFVPKIQAQLAPVFPFAQLASPILVTQNALLILSLLPLASDNLSN